MKLTVGISIQHAEYLENIAVAVVAVKFVACAVKAEDELSGAAVAASV